MIFGHPFGYQITRCVCIFEALMWFLILISLAGIRSHTWCLIAVGAMGLVYNSLLANLKRDPKTRNLPLNLLDTISTRKIMDGLMDLEETHKGCGEALLQEFFPGRLQPEEQEWWLAPKGKRSGTRYDQVRIIEWSRRLRPRSILPEYNLHATSGSSTSTPPRATDQETSPAVTPAIEDLPIVASPISGLNPLEASHYQSKIGFVGDQLNRGRFFGAARRPSLTRAEGSGLPLSGSVEPPLGTWNQGSTPIGELGALLDARQASSPNDEPILRDIAKKMPEQPFWD